jgi:hypothetical protein
MKKNTFISLVMISLNTMAQNTMTPELLWKLGRVTPWNLIDGKNVIYKVSTPSVSDNKSEIKMYALPLQVEILLKLKTPKTF